MTLPSFRAAATSSGVMETAGGAAASTRADGAVAAITAAPLMRSRLENGAFFIVPFSRRLNATPHPEEPREARRLEGRGRMLQPVGLILRDGASRLLRMRVDVASAAGASDSENLGV